MIWACFLGSLSTTWRHLSKGFTRGTLGRVTLRPGQGEGSGVHVVTAKGGKLTGAADPRREGVVLGY